jgi:hypothetical protein
MRGKLRVACLLLALFGLQAGASAAESLRGLDCCPAMAAASPEAPPPCRSLSPVGCCEERTAPAPAEVFVPPAHLLLALAAPRPACAERCSLSTVPPPGEPDARGLRTTVLRL